MKYTFKYGQTRVRDLRVTKSVDPASGKAAVDSIEVNGERAEPTGRFWRSLLTRWRLSGNIFTYFEYPEVFERVSKRIPDDHLRYCMVRDSDNHQSLLAVSSPKQPFAHAVEVSELIRHHGGKEIRFHEGVITSLHTPRSGETTSDIGQDKFEHRYLLETPVDGYGLPRTFLSLLRVVCANGQIAYAPTFRTPIRLGEDAIHSLSRALDTFDDDEGYAALRRRFESAQTSWASINEVQRLNKLLMNQQQEGHLKGQAVDDLQQVTGDLREIYGLANLDTLSVKRQRVLPARCRVYDLLNFTSELATHHASLGSRLQLHAYIGGLVADEFDMEGTAEQLVDFNNFFMGSPVDGPAASLN